jgi:hypothetical protein
MKIPRDGSALGKDVSGEPVILISKDKLGGYSRQPLSRTRRLYGYYQQSRNRVDQNAYAQPSNDRDNFIDVPALGHYPSICVAIHKVFGGCAGEPQPPELFS